MKKGPPFFTLRGIPRSEAGSALIIVLSFVVLLTVVVLAMLSHSLLNRMISNASSNVSKTDIYGHGAIDQIIGDLRQEIMAGSTVAAVTPATGGVASITSPYQIPGTTNFIYRPSSPAASVPSLSGPYTTAVFNATFPNLIKESTRNVAFEPYDATIPMRAAAINSNGSPSLNGRFVSTTRWNKALLLPKASASFSGGTGGTATTVSDSGTSPTPVPSFVAPDWILTAADGTNPTAWPSSAATTIANPKSTSYVMGRYAYTIYNEGGLLDANVAGGPWATTGSPPTSAIDGLTAPQLALYSKKGPSAFADLTQLPGIADLTTLEGGNRGQHIIDSLVGWRNAASAASTGIPKFPTYTFNTSNAGNYLTYLLGLSSNFMTTGYTGTFTSPGFADGFSGQVLTDQTFSSRQQMINFFENTIAQKGSAPLATEQAYLQDAMMYLGTFSRTLNQPSYWPDPTRPMVQGNPSGTATVLASPASPFLGNTAYQKDNIYNPPFKSIVVASPGGWSRNDGTIAVTGEPLVKKRFPLSRLMWLTYKGPSANLSTNDALFAQYQLLYTGSSSGSPGSAPAWLTQLWLEGTQANIKNNFGLTWTSGPGTGGIGGYWTYSPTGASGNPINISLLGTISGREANFFELLKAGICAGSLAKATTNTTPGTQADSEVQADSSVDMNIFQIGANIIDESNPTGYPTQIVTTTLGSTPPNTSVWGKKDLPYPIAMVASSVVTTPSVPNETTVGTNPPSTPTPNPTGTGVLLIVPTIWAPYVSNGIPAGLAPTKLRMCLGAMAPSGTASTPLFTPSDSTGSFTETGLSPGSNWPAPTANTASTGMLSFPATATASNDSLLFNNNTIAVNTLYRDPTPLFQVSPNAPAGSGLTIDTSDGTLMTAPGYAAGAAPGIVEAVTGNKYVGFYVSNYQILFPAGSNWYTASFLGGGNGTVALTSSLEYQDLSTGAWIPYFQDSSEEAYINGTVPLAFSTTGTVTGAQSALKNYPAGSYVDNLSTDPRTSRFGRTPDNAVNGSWLDSPTDTLFSSTRPTSTASFEGSHDSPPSFCFFSSGLGSGRWSPGNAPQNNYATSGSFYFYGDADGVVRRGMAGAVPATPTSSAGIPTMTVSTGGSALVNRPVMLNRPFRSVSELGYVFRDTPWKNLDFSQPESGDNALLDVFCINEDYRPNAVTAGRVDLNTKQAPVLQALLSGTYRDEITTYNQSSSAPPSQQKSLSQQEAINISQALVKRTTVGGTNASVSLTTPQPLSNIADLVGRFITGSASTSISSNGAAAGVVSVSYNGYWGGGSGASYDGFSADLTNSGIYVDPSSPVFPNESFLIQRFRETTMRSLSDSGQAGTWNLLIDVVAQSGHYPPSTTGLSNFLVEGERRYWVHIAIDRQTGQVIDENIEPVNE